MSDGQVERGELIVPGGAPEEAPAEEQEETEFVSEPAKVMRVGSMIKQLLDEVRSTELDEPSRQRLRAIYDTSVQELGSALSPDLRDELNRLAFPFAEEGTPTMAATRRRTRVSSSSGGTFAFKEGPAGDGVAACGERAA